MSRGSSRHLTALIALPITVAVGFGSLATLTGNSWFVLLAGACAGLVVASLAARHRLDTLTVCMAGPARIAVGEPAVHRLHVHNRGATTSAPMLLTHEIRGLPAVRVHVGRIPPGGRAAVDVVRPALSRGVADVATVLLEAAVPLGLLATTARHRYAQRLVVHPAPARPDRVAARRTADQDSPDPLPGPGLDLAGVREWRAGDDPRRVHWRSSARRGRLVIAERGGGPVAVLHLVVVGPSTTPDFEALVAVAAATCRAAQLDGRQVDVTAWRGSGPVGLSGATPVELLDWWAALPDATLPDPAALTRARGGHPAARSILLGAPAEVPPAWWDVMWREAAAVDLAVTPLSVAADGPRP